MSIRKRSIVIIASQALRAVAALLTAIVLVRVMAKEVFGTYRQTQLIVVFLVGLLGLNFPASLYYFVPKLGRERRRAVMSTVFAMSLAAGVVTAAFIYFGAGTIARWFGNERLAPLLRVFCLYPFPRLILNLVPPFMISLDRPLRAAAYTLLMVGMEATCAIVLAALGFPLRTILFCLVAAGGALAVVAAYDILRLSPGRAFGWDRRLLGSMLVYLLPMVAAYSVGIMNKQFDRFLIATFFDAQRYAVYACGAIELPLVGIITVAVFNAIMPDLVTRWEQEKKHRAVALWHAAVRKCSLVIYPCFVFFALCAQDFILLMFGWEYREAAWPFLIYLFVLPVRVAVYGAFLRAVGKTKPVAVSALLALLVNATVSLALVLLGRGTRLAFVGPSIGTVCATLVMVGYLLRRICRATGTPFSRVMRWKELAVTMLLCVTAGVPLLLLPLDGLHVAVRLGIRAASFGVLLLVLALTTGALHEDEKQLLRLPFRWMRRTTRRGPREM